MHHGLSHGLSVGPDYHCNVCKQETLPIDYDGLTGFVDPKNPEYEVCTCCFQKVPYAMRKTKAYQHRWNQQNAMNLWAASECVRIHVLKNMNPRSFAFAVIQQEAMDSVVPGAELVDGNGNIISEPFANITSSGTLPPRGALFYKQIMVLENLIGQPF